MILFASCFQLEYSDKKVYFKVMENIQLVNFSRKIHLRITSLKFDLICATAITYIFCASDYRRTCLHLINIFSPTH